MRIKLTWENYKNNALYPFIAIWRLKFSDKNQESFRAYAMGKGAFRDERWEIFNNFKYFRR